MKRRIFGMETEYGLIFSGRGNTTLSVESALAYLFEGLITQQSGSNVFLKNGGRIYQDTGSHPEYATPECSNVLDLLAHDKAGERIVESLLISLQRELDSRGLAGEVYIYKNNTDSVGNTYGCHENYLVDRNVDFQKLIERLIPFFVSRQIFCGAGKLLRTPSGPRYVMSQRAQHICQRVASVTTNSRSIINTRDEPHADPERYRRLHIIVGDSNMSELATYLKTGLTGLLLQVFEDRYLTRDLSLMDPVQAIREIAFDLTCRKPVKLANGLEMSALDLQWSYLEMASNYYAHHDADPIVTDLLDRWAGMLVKLERDPMSLEREVDWAAKKKLLESYAERKGIRLSDPRLLLMDMQYHDIRRDRSLYYLLEREGKVERVITDVLIDQARELPPQDTRARIRGEFVQAADRKRKSYSVDWSYVRLNDRFGSTIIIKDPFQPVDSRVQMLLASL